MKILLSRTDRIGDLILSTPAIASVRASFPDAHITMVTSAYNRVVMERSNDVDELVDLPREIRAATFGARFRGYDIAIALAPRSTDIRLVGASRARLRVGYTYVRRWVARLTARLDLNRVMISPADPELCERQPERVVPHEVDQLLDLVALAGARVRVTDLRLTLTDEDRRATSALPRDPIVLHLGQRWFSQGSTLAGTRHLAAELRELGAPLVISTAAETESFAPAFEAQGHTVVRSLPFHQWAALFERARCIVTVDTGATHVASAVRRPTLVAFEHRYFRLNSQEWAPYDVPSVLVRKPGSENEAALAAFRAQIVRGVKELIDA
ncbi:MAG TPA: glycosyltransferase family 9 protein [Candidatus Baltobacteraceae bacterium]|nr:glycosyltransferase family 9 protein [Candidatus Baltobacteraceae bacterium]